MDTGALKTATLTIIKAPQKLASHELDDRGPAGLPVGEPVAHLRSTVRHQAPKCGVWESSPGKFRRQVKEAEFSHFIAGRCKFHPDSGTTLDIEPGDAVFFPANTQGTWEIIETTRKTFIIL